MCIVVGGEVFVLCNDIDLDSVYYFSRRAYLVAVLSPRMRALGEVRSVTYSKFNFLGVRTWEGASGVLDSISSNMGRRLGWL